MDYLIMRKIGIIARCYQTISDIEFKEIGLEKGQYILMVRISENPGMSQEELSNMIKVDRTTVAKAIKKLVEKGYVEKHVDVNDRRVWKLYVTKKGSEIYDFLKVEEQYTTSITLQDFSDDEKKLLSELLEKACLNIENDWKIVKRGETRSYLKEYYKEIDNSQSND